MKRIPSIKRISSSLIVLVLFAASQIISVSPSTSAASDWNSTVSSWSGFGGSPGPSTYEDAEKLRYFFKCLADGHAREANITGSDANSLNVLSGNNSVMKIGVDLEPDDGKMNCEDIAKMAKPVLSTVGLATKDIIEGLFEPDGEGKFREIRGIPQDTVFRAKYILDNAPFMQGSHDEINKIKAAAAFSHCFQEVASGGVATTTVSGQGFIYRSGKDARSNIVYGTETTTSTRGEISCEGLAAYVDNIGAYKMMKDLGITTGRAKNSPNLLYDAVAAGAAGEQAAATARRDINNLLSGDTSKVSACATKALLPASITVEQITDWLISGDPSDLSWRIAATETKVATADQANIFKGCLVSPEGFGTELETILINLKQDLANAKEALDDAQNTEAAGDSATEADACLSSDDFLGWFACPLIESIVKLTEGLQDTIEKALKFDLSEVGSSDDGNQAIRESWSIFRSLATILLIIGFLIALLVKAIKG